MLHCRSVYDNGRRIELENLCEVSAAIYSFSVDRWVVYLVRIFTIIRVPLAGSLSAYERVIAERHYAVGDDVLVRILGVTLLTSIVSV